MTKLRRAEEFLYKGNKLKISLMFRGREMQHQNLGMDIVKRAIKDLEHIGHCDAPPRSSGRNISATLSPLAEKQRKLKFSGDEDDLSAEEGDED